MADAPASPEVAMTEAEPAADASIFEGADDGTPKLTLKIKHGKDLHEVQVKDTDTIDQLKEKLMDLTNVPPAMQKLMYKGKLEGAVAIKDTKLKDGVKVMLIGNPISTIVNQTKSEMEGKVEATAVKDDLKETEKSKEPL